jgi:hypothetical protein
MRALCVLGALLAGCSDPRGEKPVLGGDPQYLDAIDQVLPAGLVGEPYSASLQVKGGEGPYFWVDSDQTLPIGLVLEPDGEITGIPAAAGDYVLGLTVADAAGRASRVQAALQIALQPRTVACGERLAGQFLGNGHGLDGPDLTDLENLEWIAIEMPDELTTRMELVFTSEAVGTLYVERAAEPLGSPNIEDHYVPFYLNPGYTDMTVTIDPGTVPTLTGYLVQPIMPMVYVGQSPGDWEMEVVCSDGPVFVTLDQYPTELGQEVLYDFEVYGDNTGVKIWTEDELPDWMIWDETTGRITGTAMEPGTWEFTVIAETADGRRREERAIVSVYEVLDLACGQTLPLTVEESYFDGDFYAFYDPRGFAVYRLPLDQADHISQIVLSVTGSDGHYLGLAEPDPGWMNFYGGAERLYVTEPAELTVDPQSYPALGHYVSSEDQAMYFSVGTIGAGLEMSVSVSCDEQPRPDLAGLPVIQPLEPESFSLRARGGTPPYRWSAEELPSGIMLDPDGTLHGQTGAIGSYEVSLTVEDAVGSSTTGSYPLYVGNDEACASYTPIQCGDTLDGTFTEAYYSDSNGPASTRVFCLVESDQALGFEIYSDDGELRVDVADPGRSALEMFEEDLGTYVTWVDRGSSEGLGIDPYSWPSLDDFEDLPVLVALRAYNPGDWTVHLVCQ